MVAEPDADDEDVKNDAVVADVAVVAVEVAVAVEVDDDVDDDNDNAAGGGPQAATSSADGAET